MENSKAEIVESRRGALKKVGLATAALTSGSFSVSENIRAASDANTPQTQWEDSMTLSLGSDKNAYHTSVISWYGSQWFDSRNTWIHDIALATVANSQWDSGVEIEDITRNYYDFWPEDYQNGGKVDPDTNGDRQGVYPPNDSDSLPEWVELSTDLAIGALSAPAGFVVAADDMAEALKPHQGLSLIKNDMGFKFQTSPSLYDNNWSDVSHFQRALYESGSEANSGDNLYVNTKVGRGSGDDYVTDLNFKIACYADTEPYVTEDGYSVNETSSTQTTTLSTKNPAGMTKEEKSRYGVQEIDPADPPTEVRRIDGELPAYIATKCPLKIGVHERGIHDGNIVKEERRPLRPLSPSN